MPKLGENILLITDDSPFEIVKNIRNYEKYAIQLNYGAGTGTTAKLQASLNYNEDDASGDFTDIADSSQALDNAGGVHVWNVSNASYPFVKVVLTGDAVDVGVFFAGNPQPRRG